MTKKETAEIDSLREQLRLAKSLRFTDAVAPDVMPPDNYSKLSKGFLFNIYGEGRVVPACTSGTSHNFGSDDKTTTQQPRALYSTRLLALRALRHEMEQDCARRLANIDRQIEVETS